MANRKNSISTGPVASLFKFSFIGAAFSIVLCIIFTVAAALIISMTDLSHGILLPISLAITAVSSFFGALIAGRLLHRQALQLGIACGIITFAVIFTVGFFVPDGDIGATVPLKAVFTVIPSVIGGIIGANIKAKY